MKKILFTLIFLLLSFNIVLAAVPPIPLIENPCNINDMKSGGAEYVYNCFMDFTLYWFQIDDATRADYKWTADPGPVGMFTQVIIPLIALSIVTYGFMININIFGRRGQWINVAMTLLMVFFTVPTGIFKEIIYFVFTVGPMYAFVMWAILFVVGVWSIFRKAQLKMGTETGLYKSYKSEVGELDKEIKDIRLRKDEIMKRIATEKEADKIEKLQAAYKALDEREGEIHARKIDLKETFEE